MRKWTVRVEDGVGDEFAAFCARNGVSIAACLLSVVEGTVERQHEHDAQAVSEWKDERWSVIIERAREIDTHRRRRK